jgi:hypothetical protein
MYTLTDVRPGDGKLYVVLTIGNIKPLYMCWEFPFSSQVHKLSIEHVTPRNVKQASM